MVKILRGSIFKILIKKLFCFKIKDNVAKYFVFKIKIFLHSFKINI